MAFTGSTLTNSFKLQLWSAVHNFDGTHTFKMSLYDSTATLDATTTAYTATGEIVTAGYAAGGQTLTITAVALQSGVPVVDFADPTWAIAATARGALIYNSSAANKSVCVLDFGTDKTSTATFTVQMPTPDINNAILRGN